MTEVVLFHHVLGRTAGVLALAESFRASGLEVRTPDLFDGTVLSDLDEGMAFVDALGLDELLARAERSIANIAEPPVLAGVSLGVLPAQMLAQTRRARGAVLLEGCVPADEFGLGWPAGLPVQIHGMDADPYFHGQGDVDAARAIVEQAAATASGELFLYRGDRHLFTDSSSPSSDPVATELVTDRVVRFLANLR